MSGENAYHHTEAVSPPSQPELPPTTAPGLTSLIDDQLQTHSHYTLTRLHARGGIGQVWIARDESLGRDVALKELRPDQDDNPGIVARFLEEAKITGQLEHPGIVPVYGLLHTPSSKPRYAMRFVGGHTL